MSTACREVEMTESFYRICQSLVIFHNFTISQVTKPLSFRQLQKQEACCNFLRLDMLAKINPISLGQGQGPKAGSL